MSDTKITLPNPEIDYFYDGFNPTLGDPLTGASLNARFRPLMENITYLASVLETGGLDDQTLEYLKSFMPKTGGIFSGFIQAPTHDSDYEIQDFDILNRIETNNLIAETKSELISKFGSYTSDTIEGIQNTLNDLTPRVVTLEEIVDTLDLDSLKQINSEIQSLKIQTDNFSRQLTDLNSNFSDYQDSINSRLTDFETRIQTQLNSLDLPIPGTYVTTQGENEIFSTNSFKAEQTFFQNTVFKSTITVPETGSIISEGLAYLDIIVSKNIQFSELKASQENIYKVNIDPTNLEIQNINTKLESSNELKLHSPTIILSGIVTGDYDFIIDESTSDGSGNPNTDGSTAGSTDESTTEGSGNISAPTVGTPTEVVIQTLDDVEEKTELAEVLIKAKVKFTNTSSIDIPEPQELTNPTTKKYVDDLIHQQAKTEADIHNNLIESQNTLKTEMDKVISNNEEMTSKVEGFATELHGLVHTSGDETISGIKDFTGSVKVVTQSLDDDSTLVASTKFVKNVFKSEDHQYSDFTLNSGETKIVQFDSVNNYLARDARVLVYDEPNEMWINGESLITLGFTSQGFKLINESTDNLQVRVILI